MPAWKGKRSFTIKRCMKQNIMLGDLVWLCNPVITKELHCPWTGPYKILKKLSAVVYRIRDTQLNKRKRFIAHFNWLKPCPKDIRLLGIDQGTSVAVYRYSREAATTRLKYDIETARWYQKWCAGDGNKTKRVKMKTLEWWQAWGWWPAECGFAKR